VVPGSRDTAVLFNQGSASELVLVVEGTAGENTHGLVLLGNRGRPILGIHSEKK
jgi:hypothetical protein